MNRNCLLKTLIISGLVALTTAHVYAQLPVTTGSNSSLQTPAALTPETQKELDTLRAQEKELKTRIALVKDNIATYKSWFGHPLTAAQRQETKDRIEQQQGVLDDDQKQLVALQDKIKTLDPAAAASSATPDPNWPFKH